MYKDDIYEEIIINQDNITVDIEAIIESYGEGDLESLIKNANNNDTIDILVGKINNKPTYNRKSTNNKPEEKNYTYKVFDELEKLDNEFVELSNDIKHTILNLDTHMEDLELENIINEYINNPT